MHHLISDGQPMDFARLQRNLKRGAEGLPRVRVAVLGDTPTQFLTQALRGYGIEAKLDLQILEADYDQIERQILDPTSELFAWKPDYVVIFESTHRFHLQHAQNAAHRRSELANDRIARTRHLVAELRALKCQIVWCNFPEPAFDVFGNYANKTDVSFTHQVRVFNVELMRLAMATKGLYVCDLAALQNEIGRERMFSSRMYVSTGVVFELEAWVSFAKRVTDIIASLRGILRKALVLDLDNTLWGGVVGDDGIEGIEIGDLGVGRAFTEVQLWAKELKERGVLLAICSKNDEEIAKEPFVSHPDMVLKLADLAVFVANWQNKVDNLRYIKSVLNIGFDAMVFVDDNPVERDMVRKAIPELCVPDLPVDPADYLPYLQSLNLFETASFSAEDRARTQQYRDDALRVSFQKSFANESAYLASLEMVSEIRPFDVFSTPRVAQLTQRSNQFNLRTVRYTDSEIEEMIDRADCIGLSFTLSDKFGDHGLISVVILRALDAETAFIDTWLMSCRVLKRGMETFVLNAVVESARVWGVRRLLGEYVPTKKNALVKDHYRDLGFLPKSDGWELSLAAYEAKSVHIRSKEKS
jgi:FkbH-like protein